MLICPKCNKEQEEGAKFCDTCGAQLFETIFCPNCGAKMSSEFDFCEQCGASIKENVTVETTLGENTSTGKGDSKSRTFLKKALIGGGIAIAILLVVFFVGQLLTDKNNQEYCLYLKDGELVYDDFGKDGSFEITSRLLDNVEEEIGIRDSYQISSYVKYSENGRYIFYPDKVDSEEDGITLYCRNVRKENEEPIKIDAKVINYEINDGGTQVIYLKSDGGLYIHDLKNKEKIASEVTQINVKDNCQKIGFLKSNGGYYVYNSKSKENEKIASNIDFVEYVSDDLSVIYYEKEEGLYKQVIGEDDYTKIASDVYHVEHIYDSGEIYYTKENVVEVNLVDWVLDDVADVDAAMTEPECPDYPSWWDYDTEEAYEAAEEQYNISYEAYEAALDAYRAKVERDMLRDSLQESTFEESEYILYYYNGQESVVVSDALYKSYLVNAVNSPEIVYGKYNQAEVPKVKLSEISSAFEIEDLVRAALYSSIEYCLAVCDQTSVVEQTEAQEFCFTDEGNAIYFLDDISDEGHGDLYKASIADKHVQKPELIDNDVDRVIVAGNALLYYKNCDDEKDRGDLWIDGKEVDYDVNYYNVFLIDSTIYYYSDWNSETYYGTLKMYVNGKTVKIEDDVYSWIENNGNILYLYDYSWKSNSGTLYRYRKGKAEKISDDVACIIK